MTKKVIQPGDPPNSGPLLGLSFIVYDIFPSFSPPQKIFKIKGKSTALKNKITHAAETSPTAATPAINTTRKQQQQYEQNSPILQ